MCFYWFSSQARELPKASIQKTNTQLLLFTKQGWRNQTEPLSTMFAYETPLSWTLKNQPSQPATHWTQQYCHWMLLLNPEIVVLYSTPNSTAFTGCRTILLQILTKIPDKGFQDPQSIKTDEIIFFHQKPWLTSVKGENNTVTCN